MKLVDAVIHLHDIARVIEQEIGVGELSASIRNSADSLHQYSIQDDRANSITQEIIKQVKE